MKALPDYRAIALALALSAASITSAIPREAPPAPDAPWQQVITGQIEAFRNYDAPAAFNLAGLGFQASFPNAETFFMAIVQSGYGPIVESRSHGFGEFKLLGDMGVAQRVSFIGNNQMMYDAVFQLTEESGGWRVQGVHLMSPRGIAI